MRVLLLTTPKSYRAQAFIEAARRLSVDVTLAIDMPAPLAELWNQRLGVDFSNVEAATRAIVEFVAEQPVDAVLAVDDSGTLLAARVAEALGLPANSLSATEAARDKFVMRTLLAQGGVQVPKFRLASTAEDLHELAGQVEYPCVLKPLRLSGSRGVIRADNPEQFVAAAGRLAALLGNLEPGVQAQPFLIEEFIPGFEVALEGLLDQSSLHVLALFDKPDPLDGPFFEETIYVTPSRLPAEVQAAITNCASAAAAALGLRDGPMHAELRVNQNGAWLVEVAGRSIGGLCSKTLRFGVDVSLEELILRQAAGLEIEGLGREQRARGVMMIPIPEAGLLRGVEGLEQACAVPNIEEVEITARLHYPVVPLPEGDSYLGFIFARGETPDAVEAALREAHQRLRFRIEPSIPLMTLA